MYKDHGHRWSRKSEDDDRHEDCEKSRRRRSGERRHRSRSRSPGRDKDRRHGEGNRRRRDRHSPSSSSSSNGSLERRDFKLPQTSQSQFSNHNVEGQLENQYKYQYKPPSSIFAKDELEDRYSSGINMEAPLGNNASGSGHFAAGVSPVSAFESGRYYTTGVEVEPRPTAAASITPGGISIKLPPKEHSGAPAARYGTTTALNPPPQRVGTTFGRPAAVLPLKTHKVASIFNDDDDDEPEEMPPECKMRMKNVGRDTPTSAGPNSFGKTKIGFCNVTHITEKELEGTLEKRKK